MFPFQGRSPIVNIMFNTCTLISRKQIKDFVELENLQVTKKDTSDFFNKSQNFSKTMFKDELMKARPDWGLTINEQEIIIKNSSPIWKVKSLDGEINFRNGIPHFANSIFVEISKNHQVGCIYDPIRKEFFVSEFGNGSFMNDHRIRVSGKNNLNSSVLGTNLDNYNRNNLDKNHQNAIISLIKMGSFIRNSGSILLDMAWVAAGRLDGFWSRGLKESESLPGQLIVNQAGGFSTDFSMREKKITTEICMANPKIHDLLIKLLND